MGGAGIFVRHSTGVMLLGSACVRNFPNGGATIEIPAPDPSRTPSSARRIAMDGAVTFISMERTWLAICRVFADFDFVFAGSTPVFFDHALGLFGIFFAD